MATIVINDLPESMELDRQAMLAITGGSRVRAGASVDGRAAVQRVRLFEFPGGGGGDKSSATEPPSR
jgi:hypothetical protein